MQLFYNFNEKQSVNDTISRNFIKNLLAIFSMQVLKLKVSIPQIFS